MFDIMFNIMYLIYFEDNNCDIVINFIFERDVRYLVFVRKIIIFFRLWGIFKDFFNLY